MERDQERALQYRVFWQDKRWFEEHPDALLYRRPYVRGEFLVPDDDRELLAGLEQATDVEVWWSDAAAHGRPPLRFRRPVDAGTSFTDAEDARNWMLQAGPPDEDLNVG